MGLLIGIALALFLIPTFYLNFRDWLDSKGLVVHFFDSPKDLSVLEIAYFYDNKPHFKDMLAWVMDLVFRGALNLKRIEGKVYIEKVGALKAKNNLEEKAWDRFFDDFDEPVEVKVFLETYLRTILMMTFDFRKALAKKGYIKDFQKGNLSKAIIIGIIMFVLGFSFLNEVNVLYRFLVLFCWGTFCTWVTLTTPVRTVKGNHLYRKLMGFRRYLKVAEKDREKFKQELLSRKIEYGPEELSGENLEFSDLLPYMMVLNVDKKWFETLVPELAEYVDSEDFLGVISSY